MTRWIALSLALTAAAFASSLYVFTARFEDLPADVPVHWNIHGEPDRSVPREDALPYLLLSPAVMAGVVGLTLVLPWLSPRHFEVDRFRRVYDYVMALVVLLFGYIHLVFLWGILDPGVSTIRWLLGGLFLFFALLGNVLGQVRRNFWMGVRTPWTLASERVWNQTHRLAAWLFVAFGLGAFVAVLAGVGLLWIAVAFGVAVLTPVIYSLVLYKRLERQGKL
jgi:uncharacterized membrane protein